MVSISAMRNWFASEHGIVLCHWFLCLDFGIASFSGSKVKDGVWLDLQSRFYYFKVIFLLFILWWALHRVERMTELYCKLRWELGVKLKVMMVSDKLILQVLVCTILIEHFFVPFLGLYCHLKTKSYEMLWFCCCKCFFFLCVKRIKWDQVLSVQFGCMPFFRQLVTYCELPSLSVK